MSGIAKRDFLVAASQWEILTQDHGDPMAVRVERYLQEKPTATPLFMVVVLHAGAERIIGADLYLQDAVLVCKLIAALAEANDCPIPWEVTHDVG
jgi:hypothetical protein